jgi:ABC-type antimicrobial peptide transport system permease subunit
MLDVKGHPPLGSMVEVADNEGHSTPLRVSALLKPTLDASQVGAITDASAGNAVGKLVSSIFGFVINAVNGLLGMSVIVMLIGIVNTLSPSILERRRELGLLRVVVMLDKRVQRMVRLKSLVIAGIGTIAGVLLGLFRAWAPLIPARRSTRLDVLEAIQTT